MKQLWVFYLLCISLCLGSTCPYYKCDFTLTNCIDASDLPVKIMPCDPMLQYCDFAAGVCNAKPKALPGSKADFDAQCITKKRDDSGYCAGRGVKESCALIYGIYCDVGLYCAKDYTCQPVKKEGDQCSALNECASYLICNLGVPDPRCLLPFSLQPMDPRNPTGNPQLCQTGWVNQTIGLCKASSEFATGTTEVSNKEKEKACSYKDGTVLDGGCIGYSGNKGATVYCQNYNSSYASLLTDVKSYAQMMPECGEGYLNIFCEKAIDKIGACAASKALRGLYSSQIVAESYYPSCWEQKYTLLSNLYTCNGIKLKAGMVIILLITLLIIL